MRRGQGLDIKLYIRNFEAWVEGVFSFYLFIKSLAPGTSSLCFDFYTSKTFPPPVFKKDSWLFFCTVSSFVVIAVSKFVFCGQINIVIVGKCFKTRLLGPLLGIMLHPWLTFYGVDEAEGQDGVDRAIKGLIGGPQKIKNLGMALLIQATTEQQPAQLLEVN